MSIIDTIFIIGFYIHLLISRDVKSRRHIHQSYDWRFHQTNMKLCQKSLSHSFAIVFVEVSKHVILGLSQSNAKQVNEKTSKNFLKLWIPELSFLCNYKKGKY